MRVVDFCLRVVVRVKIVSTRVHSLTVTAVSSPPILSRVYKNLYNTHSHCFEFDFNWGAVKCSTILWWIMASSSSETIGLKIGDTGCAAAVSDDHNSSCEQLLDNESPHSDENIEIREGSNVESLEPCVGMEFRSLDAASEFYEMYAMRTGFTIRNGHIRRSHKDHSIIGREFVCTKEGFRAKRYLNMEKRVLPPRPITREGCNATLRVSRKGEENWVISGFVKDHSHGLNPSRIPPPQDEKDRKIRELSEELQREKRMRAACQRRLNTILKDIEEHTQNLSLKVEVIVNNVRELDSEE